jgi:hypothetical protein
MNVKYVAFFSVCVFYLFSSIAGAESNEDIRRKLKRQYASLPKITARQAYLLFCAGKALIADANAVDRFKRTHCLGAFNIPPEFLYRNARLKISKSQLICVY